VYFVQKVSVSLCVSCASLLATTPHPPHTHVAHLPFKKHPQGGGAANHGQAQPPLINQPRGARSGTAPPLAGGEADPPDAAPRGHYSGRVITPASRTADGGQTSVTVDCAASAPARRL
jgi:hypothetical protein